MSWCQTLIWQLIFEVLLRNLLLTVKPLINLRAHHTTLRFPRACVGIWQMLLEDANIYSSSWKTFPSSWITTPFIEKCTLNVKTLVLRTNDSVGFLDVIWSHCWAFVSCPLISDVCVLTTAQGQLNNWLQNNHQLAEGYTLLPNSNFKQRREVLMNIIKEEKPKKKKKNHWRSFTLTWEQQEWGQGHGLGINLRLASHSLCYLVCLYERQISLRVQLALPTYQGCCEDKNENIYVNICGVSGRHKEACLTPSINFSEKQEFSYCRRHD